MQNADVIGADGTAEATARNLGWLAFVGAGLSMVICYFVKLLAALPQVFGPIDWTLNPHVQAVLMCLCAALAVYAIWRDRRVHGQLRPVAMATAAFLMILATLYVYYDARFETLGYVLLLIAAFMNQNASLHALNAVNAAQAEELEALNASLERRVQDQVSEIDRLARLKRFLAPAVADLITNEGKDALLDSHRGFVACLFCDIRNFTALSEGVEPEEVMHVLQDFHRDLGAVVSRHGATIGFRSGDGFMALVGDPIPVESASRASLALAQDLVNAFDQLRPEWSRLGYEIGFGVGVASGYATLGMIGDAARQDYTAIGNTVNLAARLCDQAADGEILMNRRVYADAGDEVEIEPHGEVDLKGFERPVEAFRLR